MKHERNIFVFLFSVSSLIIMLAAFPLSTSASAGCYDEAYNIHDAIQYAEEHVNNANYATDYQKYYDADCTNYVSAVLHFGGGIKIDNIWYYDNNNPSSAWIKTPDLYNYLKGKGYNTYSFMSCYDSISSFLCQPGDIVFYDWGTRGGLIDGLGKNDGKPDHAAICIGINDEGMPLVAAHSSPHQNDPIVLDNGDYGEYKIYIVSMTGTAGLMDVTSSYIGKTVAIKSLESNQYVSSNTDQDIPGINSTANRDTASTWEYFDVVSGDYGEIGFKAHGNGNYLSARIDENKQYAYIQAAYGQHYSKPQSWESFRIFEKNGVQYIQSQANGKWVQAATNETDNPLKSAGASASTWERFQIEVVNTSSGSSGGTSSNGVGADSTPISGGTATSAVSANNSFGDLISVGNSSATYTIQYNANGGTGTPENQTKKENQLLTLSSSYPTKTGYAFAGWSKNRNATTADYTAGGSYTENADATLYAVWRKLEITLTVDKTNQSVNSIHLLWDSNLVWTQNNTFELYRKDSKNSKFTLIKKTNVFWDGELFDYPPYSGNYTYYVVDVASGVKSNSVDVSFSINSKATISESQREYLINQLFDSSQASDWAKEDIVSAYFLGIIPESMQKDYKEASTREKLAEMIVCLIERYSAKSIDQFLAEHNLSINKNTFSDTANYDVLACNALGIIKGMGNGRFNPNDTLTRAQIAAILNRTANIFDINTVGYTHSFSDAINHWVDSELGWPACAGIIKGVGNNSFDPDSGLTVEQAIVVAYRAYMAIEANAPDSSANSSIEKRYPSNANSDAGETGIRTGEKGANDPGSGAGERTDQNGNPIQHSSNNSETNHSSDSSGIDISNEDF